jgi:hypothetical protein
MRSSVHVVLGVGKIQFRLCYVKLHVTNGMKIPQEKGKNAAPAPGRGVPEMASVSHPKT